MFNFVSSPFTTAANTITRIGFVTLDCIDNRVIWDLRRDYLTEAVKIARVSVHAMHAYNEMHIFGPVLKVINSLSLKRKSKKKKEERRKKKE